ncbi:unnamed protein product [Malus baccata var. baccata]
MRRRPSIMSRPRQRSRARTKRDSSSGLECWIFGLPAKPQIIRPRWWVWQAVAMTLAQTMAAMYCRKNHMFLKKLAGRQKMEPMAVAAVAMRGCL